MFAIVELGGKQYKVAQNDVLAIEKMETKEGESVAVEKVLLIHDGEKTTIGTPFIKGASVTLEIIKHAQGDKVHTFKMKAKKRYKRNKGHRQEYSEVKVTAIKG